MDMRNKQPLVSVIMNCYNGERFLRESIDSVYMQTYLNWEIIFWDNGSTDSSAQIANLYNERLRYFYSRKTVLLGEARQYALEEARGKYIAFLDCDDLYYDNKLELQVKLMESSSAALCYGGALIIDEAGSCIRKTMVKDFEGYMFESLLYRYDINMQTVMIRRSIIDSDYVFFDKSLSYSPDYNLFMKISSVYNVISTSTLLSRYRVVAGSLSSRKYMEVSIEGKYTLDFILSKDADLCLKYLTAVKFAYDKLSYYDAIYWISERHYKTARMKLENIVWCRWEYFVLYLLLCVQVPKKIIMRILKR